MNKVIVNDALVDFDAALNLMDAEICEDLHAKFNRLDTATTDQDFVTAYAKAHAGEYNGEEFEVN